MKVVLSVDPVRFPLTGIGRYTYELARELAHCPQISELHYFSNRRFIPTLPEPEPVHKIVAAGGRRLRSLVLQSRLASETYRLLMPLLRQYALKSCADALYHGPNFFLPPFPGRSVATFHDLSPFTWAHCHPEERVRFWRKEMHLSLKRADALPPAAEYTRREVADYFGWSLEKVHAVPLAASNEFYPRPSELLQPRLAGYGLQPDQYTLFVGTIEPRKNLQTLLQAYERLPLPLRKRWPLVLSGHSGWKNEAIQQQIETARREGWLHYLGYVPAADLPILFAGARLFTFPSLYEGFGLPALEALQSGTPVVCSNSSSLPEVVGAAGLMCDPLDVETLTENLRKGLEDEAWRTHAIELGLQQAASFSWARCAAETVGVYQKVMGQ